MATFLPKYQNQPNNHVCFNSFKMEGLEKIKVGYKIIEVSNLNDDDDCEKKIRQLSNLISGEVKMPTEPLRIKGELCLAVVGPIAELKDLQIQPRYTVTSEIAVTSLQSTIFNLNFEKNGNRQEAKLAQKALSWAVKKTLQAKWWKYKNRFISRKADESKSTNAIQVFPAFYLGFALGKNGKFEITIDPSICNIERKSQFEKYGVFIPNITGKRFLYRNGAEFYEIDALGLGKSTSQDIMPDPNTGEGISIQEHLKNRWKGRNLPWIENLDGNALTVSYKTKGEKSRKAHSQLLFELVGLDGTDEGDATPHSQSIMSDDYRGRTTERIIGELSDKLELFGVKLKPSLQMRKLSSGEIKTFDAPKLRFADDEELSTNLQTIGKDRFRTLQQVGSADTSDFKSEQLLIFGESIPDKVRRDFKNRFCENISKIYGKAPDFIPIQIADKNCRVLREHYNAIETAIGKHYGYGLMLLPKLRKESENKKLHNHLKRNLWNQVQTQCASIENILSFYRCRTNKNGGKEWFVNEDTASLYNSYLKYLALGYLEVNQKVLWRLAEGTLRNDVHIGLDVYQNLAVFTFIYGDADLITFDICKVKRGEKLSSAEIREIVSKNLQRDLPQTDLIPSRLAFHRDGKVFDTEIRGLLQSFNDLKSLLAEDFCYGIVEIRKSNMNHPRLYQKNRGRFENPNMGDFFELNAFEGVLATTGKPLLRRGTAQPLTIEVVEGEIKLEDLAHDIYALSHLSYASPGSAMSLPFTIKLADNILKERTPGVEVNLYDDEEENSMKTSFHQSYPKRKTVGVVTI